ncbi:MAG: NERD domain-containing protein, partial [Anaerolineae bacterium]|nr:NERD domain-containing protein [Anaerolineae bacterium]
MIGSRTTCGETLIQDLLKKFPKDECLFYFEPMIVPEEGAESNPDFVLIMRDKGVVIVEVKDWVKLIKGNPKQIHIERRSGEVVPEKNPYNIARDYALELADKLEKRAELCRRYQGKVKLKFPWMASVALPNIKEKVIRQLEEGSVWTKGTVFGRETLTDSQAFYDALMNIPVPHGVELKAPLDEVTIEAIRGVIYPEIQVINEQGEDLGTLTIPQEVLMKEEVTSLQPKQMPLMDMEMLSHEATHVATSIQTRLVRGVAGSGKTLVL